MTWRSDAGVSVAPFGCMGSPPTSCPRPPLEGGVGGQLPSFRRTYAELVERLVTTTSV
jgi:hypothetical protein